MHSNIKSLSKKMLEICEEIDYYDSIKENLNIVLDRLFREYQSGKISSKTYESRLKAITKGKSGLYWNKYYDSIIYSLLKKIEYINSQIFYYAYHDDTIDKLGFQEPEFVMRKEYAGPVLPPEEVVEISEEEKRKEVIVSPEIRKPEAVFSKPSIAKPEAPKETQKIQERITTREIRPEKPAEKFLVTPRYKEQEKKMEKERKEEKRKIPVYAGFGDEFYEIKKKKPSIWLQLKSFLNLKPESPITDKSSERVLKKGIPAKKLKAEMEEHEREFKKVQKPMKIGKVTSHVSRGISTWLINKYPGFFKNIFTSLRQANISILSHTYVNVMVFFSTLVTLVTLLLWIILFYLLGNTVTAIIIKSIVFSLLLGVLTFFIFYYYPQAKASQRRKSIKSNLPFAVTHVAAIASAGIEPGRMLKIISKSREYGEISVEFAKIVEYIDIFGYDILTAVKYTANTTPSKEFKDFLDGFVSTIESGGDLNRYLAQKSDEIMLTYELERKKYIDLITTMSDVYTGVMMAAPMFLIVTLSLIGILGGRLFGMPIQSVIIIGTYLLIPLVNLIFVIFLQAVQPST